MLTILMATYNGAKNLTKVLAAYHALVPPAGGWKLLIVDNASTDNTQDVIAQHAKQLPIYVLFTEKRGKNIALNIGLQHIEGDLVVFTDDDAIPAPNWLVSLREVADSKQDYDIFGGQINPVWPENLPEWIPRLVNLGATFAVTPTGMPAGPTSASQIWGPNMAVRSKVFAAGHAFNEAVGPQAGQYMMGSEVEFTCRIERLGHKAWFTTDAVVGHIIRDNQIDRDWIIQRGFRLGRHMFHQEQPTFAAGTSMLRGAPRWKYRNFLKEQGRLWRSTLLGNTDQKFLSEWEISFLKGYLSEARSTQTSSQNQPSAH